MARRKKPLYSKLKPSAKFEFYDTSMEQIACIELFQGEKTARSRYEEFTGYSITIGMMNIDMFGKSFWAVRYYPGDAT